MHLHDGCSQQPALIRRLSTHAAPSNFKELMNFMIKVGPIVAVLTSVGGSVIYLTNVVRTATIGPTFIIKFISSLKFEGAA